uniref:Uncharacterized protein n=1 Tax=Siphoviridae sp. ctqwO1 TaxID=2826472 RepID=A0A8S5QPE6_9CAUD|nr:MAG TPA: hypothetical protein [Siphoviridae sp. ctqwO1]
MFLTTKEKQEHQILLPLPISLASCTRFVICNSKDAICS